ncbi:MAG: TolC family protein [Mariprofundales bacterium]|nr:TolC family protein [Mariprofundales bacterium]
MDRSPFNIQQMLALIVITIILFPLSARAEQPQLSLAQAEALAVKNSPALAATAYQAKAMAAIPSQVGSLPDPSLDFKAINLPVDSFSTSQENMTQLQFGFTQAIPFPGKLALKAKAAEQMAQAALHNSKEFRLKLLSHVRIRWWNLIYLDHALAIVRRNQALLRNLVRIAETKYKTGRGLQQDVLLAQMELSKLLEKELSISTARIDQRAAFNALLGRSAATPVMLISRRKLASRELATSLNFPDQLDIPSLKQMARRQRPMLAMMDAKLGAADARLALANKGYYPDFKLGAAYGVRQGVNMATKRTRPDFASVMVSMTLPIYADHKQDKEIDQRTAEREASNYSLQDAEIQVDAEIDAAAADLRISRDRVRLFRQGILPQARQTTASMLAGYEVNKVDFLNLVRAQLNEFNMDIRYWQQVSLAHQAEARLLAAAGKDHWTKDGKKDE